MESWEKRIDGIDKFINEKMKDWEVPGLALAVVKDGEVILSKGYGLRNVEENLPVTEESILAIGSASKAFTSTALAILVDEGKLEWDTPIIKYIPWFKMYDKSVSDKVTVRDLLCHRTGLPRHDFMWYKASFSRKEIVERIQYLQPNKDFRSVCQYQNHMITLAGYLIEAITGKTWEEFVQERIFKPLGMNSSNFSVEKSQKAKDYSKPYGKDKGKVVELPFANIDVIGPAGSINSNIKDMTKWLSLQLNKGKHSGKQIVSEANIGELHTPQIPFCLYPWKLKEVQNSCYGLAWFIDVYRGHKLVNHGGNIDGFSSLVSFMPEENLGIVVLTNKNVTFITLPLIYSIYDRLLGYEDKDWSKVLKEIVDGFDKQMEGAYAAMRQPGKQGTKPSHSLEDYVGKFEHPGYGIVTIYTKDQGLRIKFNSGDFDLVHHNYDVFRFEYYLGGDTMPFYLTFNTDVKGDVVSCSIPFEMTPGIDAILFKKIPENK